MMKGIQYYLFLSLLFYTCTSNTNERVCSDVILEDSLTVKEDKQIPLIDSNAIALQLENFEKLYLLNGGTGTITVDSVATDSLIITYYNTLPKNPGQHDRPYLWFTIYHFKQESMATDFFNDLKTQEMVLSFGINKRPKNVLLNGDKVIWHQMEHSYGHHYLEYLENFKTVMNLNDSANNLDSLLGFAYCTCYHRKADLKLLKGSWKTRLISKISTKNLHNYNYFEDTTKFTNNNSFNIKITKDSLIIDKFKNIIKNTSSSIEFPDSYYLMEYKFLKKNYNPHFYDTIVKYAPKKFLNELKKIKSLRSKVIAYNVHLGINQYPDIFYINSKLAYMSFNGYFYQMTRP